MATTVGDVNRAFLEKNMTLELPYPEDWTVRDIQILEKKDSPTRVRVLLAVELDRQGKVFRDLCYLEGDVARPARRPSAPVEAPAKKQHILPVRDRVGFESDGETRAYLLEAFSSLLLDNEYLLEPHAEADLHGRLGSRGFFVMVACRCDEGAAEQGERLVRLRKKYRHVHDYGLVMPAFQEPLGVPLARQESWVAAHAEAFSMHRVGLYGVDNTNPNVNVQIEMLDPQPPQSARSTSHTDASFNPGLDQYERHASIRASSLSGLIGKPRAAHRAYCHFSKTLWRAK